MNVYNWQEGKYVITFIVGNKYCTCLVDRVRNETDVFDAVKEWHDEQDPNGVMVPFVVVSDMFVTQAVADWYIENNLTQVQVGI